MMFTETIYLPASHKGIKQTELQSALSANLWNRAVHILRQQHFCNRDINQAKSYFFQKKEGKVPVLTGRTQNFSEKELLKLAKQDYFQIYSENEIKSLIHRNLKAEGLYDSVWLGLKAKVSAMTIKAAVTAYWSFVKAEQAYKQNPKAFTGPPKPPKYKTKDNYHFLLTFEKGAISKNKKKPGWYSLSGTQIEFKSKIPFEQIKMVTLSKTNSSFKVCVQYEDAKPFSYNGKQKPTLVNPPKKPVNVAAIDLGNKNLATVTFNTGIAPVIISGGPILSINQWYQKRMAELKKILKKNQPISVIGTPAEITFTKQMKRLTDRRNRKVESYLHQSTTQLINHLVSNNIDQLIIGYNPGWKQEINIGKKNNQNFCSIPHLRFVQQLEYKFKLRGGKADRRTEEYTSKCSALDLETIEKHDEGTYLGKRIKRGLFKTAGGRLINADVNGSLNIMRNGILTLTGTQLFLCKSQIEGLPVDPVNMVIRGKSEKKVMRNKVKQCRYQKLGKDIV